MKRCVCVILFLIVCIAFSVLAFADFSDEDVPQEPADYSLMSIDFSGMSIEELNDFIHSIAVQYPNGDDCPGM